MPIRAFDRPIAAAFDEIPVHPWGRAVPEAVKPEEVLEILTESVSLVPVENRLPGLRFPRRRKKSSGGPCLSLGGGTEERFCFCGAGEDHPLENS